MQSVEGDNHVQVGRGLNKDMESTIRGRLYTLSLIEPSYSRPKPVEAIVHLGYWMLYCQCLRIRRQYPTEYVGLVCSNKNNPLTNYYLGLISDTIRGINHRVDE